MCRVYYFNLIDTMKSSWPLCFKKYIKLSFDMRARENRFISFVSICILILLERVQQTKQQQQQKDSV